MAAAEAKSRGEGGSYGSTRGRLRWGEEEGTSACDTDVKKPPSLLYVCSARRCID